MLKEFIQKKLKNLLTPELKATMLQTLAQKAKDYRDSIELDEGELLVAGLLLIEGDTLVFRSCTMRAPQGQKLAVGRVLHQFTADELADLLLKNLDKADLSKIMEL